MEMQFFDKIVLSFVQNKYGLLDDFNVVGSCLEHQQRKDVCQDLVWF